MGLVRPTDIADVVPATVAAIDALEHPQIVVLSQLGYQDGWSDANADAPARAARDATGTIHLGGVITRAATPGGIGPIVTLPTGFLPDLGGLFFLCSCTQTPLLIADVGVAANGTMTFRSCSGAPAPIFIDLGPTSFLAARPQ